MVDFLKKTQTLIGSLSSNIANPIITRIKPECQSSKGYRLQVTGYRWTAGLISLYLLLFTVPCTLYPAFAIVDPRVSLNNKFGIHILSAVPDEASAAATFVNSKGGDWGYVTLLIENRDRDKNRLQQVFDDLRRRHLIPLVRIATHPEGSAWKVPTDGEENIWAEFLNSLKWPVKNRYVIIYNEPNQGQEWGGQVDSASYAKVLDKTIAALKAKNEDFFVLNAGFDASAPNKAPSYADELIFLQDMNKAVPGIFNKLDGWSSHSYPNPGFVGSPEDTGRGTTSTWAWEMEVLYELGLNKSLPVFITETGWKHAEGINFDKSLPDADKVAQYYKYAFENTWTSSQIVAITPFILNYQENPFDHFSFKKLTGEKQNLKILGLQYPEYYSPFTTLADLPKSSGRPVQVNKAELVKGALFTSIVAGEEYTIPLTFKNTGQSTWNEYEQVKLVILKGGQDLGIQDVELPKTTRVEPGGEYAFILHVKSFNRGSFNVSLALVVGKTQFEEQTFDYTVEVKQPVILQVKVGLRWGKDAAGVYLFKLSTVLGDSFQKILLTSSGESSPIDARLLLPDYSFDFTLNKPYYKTKTLHQTVHSGVNTLDFGIMEPDFFAALFQPDQFIKLLP